jgi:lipopolysaccharide export system protein LptA
MRPIKPVLTISLSLVLLVGSLSAHALKSDRNQPIKIEADRVEINEKTQISYYRGNVSMQQGSLKIKADEVTVYMKDGALHRVFITGAPAHFEQIPDDRKELVKSRAKQMEYFAKQQRLLLKQEAEVVQGANLFRGDQIEYDTLTSTVKAQKDASGDTRVHAIIQPADKDKTDTPNQAPEQKK